MKQELAPFLLLYMEKLRKQELTSFLTTTVAFASFVPFSTPSLDFKVRFPMPNSFQALSEFGSPWKM